MRTFVEVFIKYINELTTNRQLYDDVFINFRKNDEIVYIIN